MKTWPSVYFILLSVLLGLNQFPPEEAEGPALWPPPGRRGVTQVRAVGENRHRRRYGDRAPGRFLKPPTEKHAGGGGLGLCPPRLEEPRSPRRGAHSVALGPGTRSESHSGSFHGRRRRWDATPTEVADRGTNCSGLRAACAGDRAAGDTREKRGPSLRTPGPWRWAGTWPRTPERLAL